MSFNIERLILPNFAFYSAKLQKILKNSKGFPVLFLTIFYDFPHLF